MGTWSGFHRMDAQERLDRVAQHAGLTDADQKVLAHASALAPATSAAFIENAVGSFPVPLGFAVGFVIDEVETVVPMAVEESSVVAAACNGARLAALGGGFRTEAAPGATIGQVEVRSVPDRAAALAAIAAGRQGWMASLDAEIPAMVERGGGLRDITVREVGDDRVVVHLHVDTCDAMGANVVNSLCESIADRIVAATGGRPGLRILSNLATQRLVSARCEVPVQALGGPAVAAAMVEANEFALLDPYRAATHNKGLLNGIDPIALATGNDWRAVEAGAHSFAARDGQYRGLTRYRLDGGVLRAELSLPVSVGTIGGVTSLHPVARACLKVLGSPDADRLGRIMAAVGLAQNLAALRALSDEGIQEGHMRLHGSNLGLVGDAQDD